MNNINLPYILISFLITFL